jgi:ABC-2 type transport system ATP-binding protein
MTAFALRGVDAATGNGFAPRDVSFELPTGYVMGLIGDFLLDRRR